MDVNCCRKPQGFSLIELIIVVAVIGILSAIIIPTYQNYIQSSRQAVATQNMQQLALAENEYFYDRDAFRAGKFDAKNDIDTLNTGLLPPLGWQPNNEGGEFVYDVAACAGGAIANCYTITVKGFAGGVSIEMTRRLDEGV
jgi:prepilin-type N-terminal cleavage/methylation domain-containing protein